MQQHRAVTVLDVRRTDESSASWIKGAVKIPIDELPRRMHEVPAGEIWVHCAAGYGASIAASLLAADVARRNRRRVRQRTRSGPDCHCPGRSVTLAVVVVAGALIGVSLGALGGGGSVLTVPVLVYGLRQSAVQATTGSLVVVGITALWSRHRLPVRKRAAHQGACVRRGSYRRRHGGRESIWPGHRPGTAGRVRRAVARGRRSDGCPSAPIPARAARSTPGDPRRRPDHHFQPLVRMPLPACTQSACHRHRGGPANGFLGVGGGFSSFPHWSSHSGCRCHTPPELPL